MSKLIETIVSAIQDKKGKQIVSLDMSALDGSVCDAFVICHADSPTQVEAICQGVEDKARKELGEKPWRIEGQNNGIWIVIDYVDVMVHIFQTDLRDFYRLEELWADAPITRYESEE